MIANLLYIKVLLSVLFQERYSLYFIFRFYSSIFVVGFETGSHFSAQADMELISCAAQAGLKFMTICLPQCTKLWDRHELLRPSLGL